MLARSWPLPLAVAAALLCAAPARADDAGCAVLARENVARCAVSASAVVAVERAQAMAAIGRRTAADPWFPQAPTLSLTAARRAGTEGRQGTVNYAATLSQEIEIAGE